MNSPQDPRKEPFQDDEAALAKVLRALPGSEPSPRVDAAILAAARDATSGSAKRQGRHRRRGLPGWALGTAAAAVLAVGIGLQLQPGRDAVIDGLPTQAPAESLPGEDQLDQIEVSGSRLERMPSDASTESGAAKVQAKPASPAPASQAQAAPAAPPPPAPAQTLERRARLAPEPVAESAPVSDAAAEAGALPSAFRADEVLPPVGEDARLDPDAWLERIRERIRQGDRAGAKASLHRFERAHPDLSLPPDLAAFRP